MARALTQTDINNMQIEICDLIKSIKRENVREIYSGIQLENYRIRID